MITTASIISYISVQTWTTSDYCAAVHSVMMRRVVLISILPRSPLRRVRCVPVETAVCADESAAGPGGVRILVLPTSPSSGTFSLAVLMGFRGLVRGALQRAAWVSSYPTSINVRLPQRCFFYLFVFIY